MCISSRLAFVSTAAMLLGACSAPLHQEYGAQPFTDVTPVGGLGMLQVRFPPADQVPAGQTVVVSDEATAASAVASVVREKVYQLRVGRYCLAVASTSSLQPYTHKRCGFVLQKDKTTVVDLAVLKPNWDVNQMRVDLGFRASFDLLDGAAPTTTAAPILSRFMDVPSELGKSYLLISGDVSVRYGGPAVLKNEIQKVVNLAPLVTTESNFTPRELRGTLQINVSERKFGPANLNDYGTILVGDTVVLGHFRAPIDPTKYEKSPLNPAVAYNEFASWVYPDFYTDKKKLVFPYKAFPLQGAADSNNCYGLVVNNNFQQLQVQSNVVTNVNIDPMNVNPVNGTTPGYYKLYQMMPDASSPTGWKVAREQMPVRDGRYFVDGRYFPTSTTIHLAFGYKYLLVSFLVDDAGNYVKQSEHDIDLMQ